MNTTIESINEVTPRSAAEMINDAIESRLVPFLRSSPGIGKSSIYRAIAKKHNLQLIDHRLSTSAPEDLSGLPDFTTDENGTRKARFVPFSDLFPVVTDELPEGKDGWLIFLDEMNHASKEVQAASYKLILDRYVGQTALHERVAMGAAGNLDTDRAMVNPISTAMQSRVVHLVMRYDFQEWFEDVLIPEKWDSRIVTFLSQWPSKGMNFRSNHNDYTFACPRTWEFMNKLIKGKTFKVSSGQFEMNKKLPLYSGTIGPGIATEFVNYCRVWTELPHVQTILDNPETLNVPTDGNIRYATVGLMVENTDKDNFEKFAIYADRFPANIRILFYRMIIQHYPELFRHPAFASRMVTLNRYFTNI